MTTKRSLAYQRMAVEDLIARVGDDPDCTVIEAAKQAALTIAWIERREELIKMIEKLRKDNPDLYDLFVEFTTRFPGASLADIRATEREAERAGL